MPGGYRRTRLEAIVAVLIWLAASVWTLTAAHLLSAERPVRLVGGVPHWIVWGVLLPWATAFAVHLWYSLVFVRGGREE